MSQEGALALGASGGSELVSRATRRRRNPSSSSMGPNRARRSRVSSPSAGSFSPQLASTSRALHRRHRRSGQPRGAGSPSSGRHRRPSRASPAAAGAGWMTSFLARNYPSGPHELAAQGHRGRRRRDDVRPDPRHRGQHDQSGAVRQHRPPDQRRRGRAASLTVLGWALDDSDIDHIDFEIDGAIVATAVGRGGAGNATFGGKRPDVYAAFPDFPGTDYPDPKSLYSGFVTRPRHDAAPRRRPHDHGPRDRQPGRRAGHRLRLDRRGERQRGARSLRTARVSARRVDADLRAGRAGRPAGRPLPVALPAGRRRRHHPADLLPEHRSRLGARYERVADRRPGPTSS